MVTHSGNTTDVDQYAIQTNTARAVDEFIDCLSEFYHRHDDTTTRRLIVDMRVLDTDQIRLLALQLREVVAYQPRQMTIYFALVLADEQTVDIATALLKTIFRRDTVQYFTRIDTAQQWLALID